jgi:uncharacterized protein YkwD
MPGRINHSLLRLTAAMAVLFALGATAAQAAPLAPDFTGCGNGTLVPAQNADYEQQVLDRVNLERANAGQPPLQRVNLLDNAARYQSADLAQDNYFAHDSFDRVGGNLVQVCAWYDRVKTYYPSPGGENIAAGSGTPQSVMDGWMNSPGHKANILSANYWEIGVGYYAGGGQYGVYWTQDFGKRSGVYPLLINRDAATTDTRSTAIYIYGNWTQMRLHNDSDAPGGWQPFQHSFNWTLNPGVGAHTVTAELSNVSMTATSSDSITLLIDNTPVLTGLPDNSGFIYSLVDQAITSSSLVLAPGDLNPAIPLTWTITSKGSWFSISATSGTTPATLTITPKLADVALPGSYTGSITVTITSPAGVVNNPHTTQLTLVTVASPLLHLYLPVLAH